MQNILTNLPDGGSRRLVIGYSLLVLGYIGLYVWVGGSGDTDPTSILAMDPILLLLLQGVLAGLFFILIPALFLVHTLKIPIRTLIGTTPWLNIFYLFIISVSGMVVLSAVVQWNLSLEFGGSDFQTWAKEKEDVLKVLTEHIINFKTVPHFLLALLVIGAFAAIGEELLFRGLLQNLLADLTGNKHAAIWIAAIIFSAIHLQFYGFFPRMLLGALFGYLYLWSGRLVVPILAHFLHNGLSLVIAYLAVQKFDNIPISAEQMDQAAPWSFIILFLVLGVFAIVRFRKFNSA